MTHEQDDRQSMIKGIIGEQEGKANRFALFPNGSFLIENGWQGRFLRSWRENCWKACQMQRLSTWTGRTGTPGFWRVTVAILFGLFVGVAAGRTVIAFSGSVSVVDGESMSPTYAPGARVMTVPVTGELERGAVVMLDDGKGMALKRVVGLPGEVVQFWRGYVFINGRMLREPYLPKYTFTFPDERRETFRAELGEGEYFVMGDNRVYSVDSRAYGPVCASQIRSRVARSESDLEAQLASYTLPEDGKRCIRKL